MIVPKGGWLTVNKKCNLRCAWCYAKGANYSNSCDMSFDMAQRLTLLMSEIGIKRVIVLGGEPTLWKYLFLYNDFCKDIGMETVLITNGLMFSDDKFYEEYQKHPNTNIGISLKAANPKQFFEATSSNLFNLVRIGVPRAIELNGMVSLTYNTFYEKNLLELVDFAVKCGSKTVKIDFCSVTFENGKPSDRYMVSPKQLVANIIKDYSMLCDLAENIVFEFQLPLCLFPAEFIDTVISKKQIINVCHVHQRLGVIFDSNGGLLMCNSLFDYPMGYFMIDFETSDQLLNFMNSSNVLDCQQQISRYPHDKCRNCDKYDICAGGCPLKWAIYKPESLLKGGDRDGTIKNAY